jgi:hydroxypyruvate isomerase
MNLTSFAPITLALATTLASLPAQADGLGEASYQWPTVAASQAARAEVRRQAAEANAAGRLPHGELGLAVEPGRSLLSRTQVRAEAQEAIRLGLTGHGEQTVLPTVEQLASIRLAGLRAVAAETLHMAAR